MVGMGFRRIALAQGLLDGPQDRNPPRREPVDSFTTAPKQDRLTLAADRPCSESTVDSRMHLGR